MYALRILSSFKPYPGNVLRTILPTSSHFHSTAGVQFDSRVIGSDYVVRSPLPDIELPQGDIYRMISGNFSKFGTRIGLVDGISGREYSYNELDESSCKFSSGLQRIGFSGSDVMCIVSPNCPEYAVTFLGILRSGGVVSTSNPAYTADELAFQFRNSGARMVTTIPAILSTVQAAAAKANVEKIIVLDGDDPQSSSSRNLISYQSLLNDSGPLSSPVFTEPEDVAVLPYSSGTTGFPKGVMLTNYNVSSNLLQLIHPELFNLSDIPSACLMGVLPFFHIYGMVVVLLSSLYAGTKVVSLPKFEPELFLSAIEKYRIDIAHVVPPLVLFFAKHPLVDKYDISSLNEIMTGAAPLGGDMVKAAIERTKCDLIRQGYGLTETSPVSHMMLRSLGTEFPSSVGYCIRSQKVKIVDPETNETLPPNKEGEVWMHGPNIMKGYLNNPEATQNCIVENGWFRTGDLGYYDEQGLFYITDRLKELIKVKGLQVAPAELEAILLTHPKISDVAVIGIPNERLGEAPKAFVVKKEEGLKVKEVQEFVAGKVTQHKHLAGGVEFIEAIPKSPSGKILRRILRK